MAWSIESVVVGVYARAAVAVQGVLDVVGSLEHRSLCKALGFDPETRVWPETLSNGAKVTYVPKDGADRLADAEAEIDAWEPGSFGCTSCGGYRCPDCTVWCDEDAQPADLCRNLPHSSVPEIRLPGAGTEPTSRDLEAVHDEGYDRGRADGERIAVGMSPNVYNPYRITAQTSPPASAGLGISPTGVSADAEQSPASSPPVGYLDPSPTGGEASPADDATSLAPAGDDPGWLIPAIQEVLADHRLYSDRGGSYCTGSHYEHFEDAQAWREHVSAVIAERIAAAQK